MKKKIISFLVVVSFLALVACQEETVHKTLDEENLIGMPNPFPEETSTFVKNYTFSGRYMVEEWCDPLGRVYYQLEDGTVLLRLYFLKDDIFDTVQFEEMTEKPSTEVIDHMELYFKQVPIYDLEEELSYAYGKYQELGEEFQEHILDYSISITHETEQALFFTGSLTYSITGKYAANEAHRVVFYRDTGEEMYFWDIFAVTPERLQEFLRELMAEGETGLEGIVDTFGARNIYLGDDLVFLETNYTKQEVRNGYAMLGDVNQSMNATMGLMPSDFKGIVETWVYP